MDTTLNAGREVALLGGGCFWCLEAVFAGLRGVTDVQSGYAGGEVAAPSYEAVCTGRTGHAEVVRIEFAPDVLPFATLLDVFFAIHDPTTLNRQGNDVGTQYRSVIFCQSPAQENAARHALDRVDASGEYRVPAVTEIAGAAHFYPAEAYHRRYFERNGHQPYCSVVVAPKLAKARKRFAALFAGG